MFFVCYDALLTSLMKNLTFSFTVHFAYLKQHPITEATAFYTVQLYPSPLTMNDGPADIL